MKLSQTLLKSELSLVVVDAQLSRDGTPVPLTGPMVSDKTFSYIFQIESFETNDSGNYTCSATVQSNSAFLNMSDSLSHTLWVTTGEQITSTALSW